MEQSAPPHCARCIQPGISTAFSSVIASSLTPSVDTVHSYINQLSFNSNWNLEKERTNKPEY